MERAAGCCRQHGLWRTCLARIIMADKSTAGMLLPSTHPVLGSRARLVRSRGSGTRYPSTRRTYSSSNSHRSPRCYRAQPEDPEYPGRVPRVPRPSTQSTPPEYPEYPARGPAERSPSAGVARVARCTVCCTSTRSRQPATLHVACCTLCFAPFVVCRLVQCQVALLHACCIGEVVQRGCDAPLISDHSGVPRLAPLSPQSVRR